MCVCLFNHSHCCVDGHLGCSVCEIFVPSSIAAKYLCLLFFFPTYFPFRMSHKTWNCSKEIDSFHRAFTSSPKVMPARQSFPAERGDSSVLTPASSDLCSWPVGYATLSSQGVQERLQGVPRGCQLLLPVSSGSKPRKGQGRALFLTHL